MAPDALLPDEFDQVYVKSADGTRCVITTTELCCQNDQFTASPVIDGMQANGVRIDTDAVMSWIVGDLGNIPAIELDSTYTYRALGWTITTRAGGDLRFTNDQTGCSVVVGAHAIHVAP
ncbi:hypothetical protein H7I77_10010 [Mycolicibacterium novocastrense]|nr:MULTISPECIES: hypothetical protein [Mycolicibacterium]MCV7023680.1 hypothetical protein [Mycolicibacterium novocastrense]MDX1886917.1 hypothetical protein [Mycolicibacterium sp. 120270]